MSIKNKAISGVKWTTVSTITIAAVSILQISILARFLDKSEFGLMALVTFILGLMNLFNDMGLSSAILHKQNITKKEYSSLYWLNILVSIFLYIILLSITPVFSNFYNQGELKILVPILGLNIIISAIGRQFKVKDQKDFLFKRISIIEMVASVLSLFLAIVLATRGFGVYALVYPALFQYIISNTSFLLTGMKRKDVALHFNFNETRPFLRMGLYQVGGQVISYFNTNIDVLLIGKFFPPGILGGYNLAKQLVMRPVQIINPIVLRVASSVLVKFQMDRSALKIHYLKLINMLSSVNVIVYGLIMIFAPLIVKILYGNNYDHIVILVRILSVYMIFRGLWNPISSLVIATGRTDLEFKWNLIALFIMPLFIFIGAQLGIVQVTLTITMAMVVLFIPSWKYLVQSMTGATLKEYISAITKINISSVLQLRR